MRQNRRSGNLNNWNLPVRRTMGNYNLPARRALGDWKDLVVSLTPAEVSEFLRRHPDVAERIQIFQEQIRSTGGYQQGNTIYAIPEYGFSVSDAVFGNVAIFPDAAGQIRFTGHVPDDIAVEVNKPPYTSPTGGPDTLDALLAAVPWIVGGLLGLMALNAVRGK
jgi:hypothetical protein